MFIQQMKDVGICTVEDVLPSTGIIAAIVFILLLIVFLCQQYIKDGNIILIVLAMLPLRAVTLDIIAATTYKIEEVKTLIYMGVTEANAFVLFVLFTSYWAYQKISKIEDKTSDLCNPFRLKLSMYALVAVILSLLPSIALIPDINVDKIVGHVLIASLSIVLLAFVFTQICTQNLSAQPIFDGLKLLDYFSFWAIVVSFSFVTYFVEECFSAPLLSGLLSVFPADAYILFLRFGHAGNSTVEKVEHFRTIAHYLLYVSSIEISVILTVTLFTELRINGVLEGFTQPALIVSSLMLLVIVTSIFIIAIVSCGFSKRVTNSMFKNSEKKYQSLDNTFEIDTKMHAKKKREAHKYENASYPLRL